MKVLRNFVFTLLLAASTGKSSAQCPPATITAPDSACAMTELAFQSSFAGPGSVEWDFSTGEGYSIPQGNLLTNNPGAFASSLGLDFAKVNGNYIGFTINVAGNLTRLEFGPSLAAAPVVSPLGNLGILGGNADLRLWEENGMWYALSNSLGGQLYRIDFGNSLLNTPTVTVVNIPGGNLNTPYYIWAGRAGSDLICLLANNGGGSVTVVNFGSSILNNSPAVNTVSVPGSSPISVSFGNDCGNFIAYVSYLSSSPVSRIDFGNNVLNPPVSISSFNSSNAFAFRRSELFHDGKEWHLLNHSSNGDNMQIFHLGNDLSSINPASTVTGSFSYLAGGMFNISLRKFGSELLGLNANYNTGDLGWFRFPELNGLNSLSDTSASPLVTFTQPGWYSVGLMATDINYTTNYIQDSIYIHPLPIAGFSTGAVCEGSPVFFTDTSFQQNGNITHWAWNFGDGATDTIANPQHSYTSAGSYTVELIVQSEFQCTDTLYRNLQVGVKPSSNFSFTDSTCSNVGVSFTDISTGTISNWFWDFGDGNTSSQNQPVHTYSSDGTFGVQLIVYTPEFCSDTLIQPVTVLPSPQSDFLIQPACFGDTVYLINQSSINGGSPLQSLWIFAGTDSSQLVNPSYLFGGPGNDLQIVLEVRSNLGCIDTSARLFHLAGTPQVSFSISDDTACAGAPVYFDDLSQAAPGDSLKERYWDFGDGSTDTTQGEPLSHSYLNSGIYVVTLTVLSPDNCLRSISDTLYISPSPQAAFSFTSICEGETIQFTDQSIPVSGNGIAAWNWQFGTGDSSLNTNPTYLYPGAGSYQTTLTVTGTEGCTSSIIDSVPVHALPVANFTWNGNCALNPIQFNDSSFVSNSTITQWQWDFGNGQSSLLNNPTQIFSSSAAYPVELIVSSAFGCRDTITKLLAVLTSPVFNIQLSDHCEGVSAPFTYVPLNPSPANASFLWNFGDSTFSFQSNPSHLYASAGNYTVSLIVSDLSNGCQNSLTDTISVFYKPQANFSAGSACKNVPVQFNDSSQINEGYIAAYEWSFPGNGISNLVNPTYIFTQSGNNSVRLLVESDRGCIDSIAQTIQINENPQASFAASPTYGAPPLPVSLQANTGSGLLQWDFGDGSTGTGNNLTHIYTDSGQYLINLTFTDSNGCSGTSTENIYVFYPTPDLAVLSSDFVLDSDFWIVRASVRNTGNTRIDEYRLLAQLENESPFAETFSDSAIEAGEIAQVEFSGRFPAGYEKPAYVCVRVLEVNGEKDSNPTNDEACSSQSLSFQNYPLYPNPATDFFTLPVYIPEQGGLVLEIFTIEGKKLNTIYNNTIDEGFHKLNLDCSSLSAGYYIIRSDYVGEERRIPFIKK